MLILMDRNYHLFQKLVQLVCYQNNQNDLEIFENTGIYFFSHLNSNLFCSIHTRSTDHFVHSNEIQLNEEELRQIEMRTYDTTINSNTINNNNNNQTDTKISSSSIIPNEKIHKPDQHNDGTLSDSVLTSQPESNKKRRPSKQSKAFVILGLSKKANSSSNLGYGKSLIIKIK